MFEIGSLGPNFVYLKPEQNNGLGLKILLGARKFTSSGMDKASIDAVIRLYWKDSSPKGSHLVRDKWDKHNRGTKANNITMRVKTFFELFLCYIRTAELESIKHSRTPGLDAR